MYKTKTMLLRSYCLAANVIRINRERNDVQSAHVVYQCCARTDVCLTRGGNALEVALLSGARPSEA